MVKTVKTVIMPDLLTDDVKKLRKDANLVSLKFYLIDKAVKAKCNSQ